MVATVDHGSTGASWHRTEERMGGLVMGEHVCDYCGGIYHLQPGTYGNPPFRRYECDGCGVSRPEAMMLHIERVLAESA